MENQNSKNSFKVAIVINIAIMVFGLISCTMSYFFNDKSMRFVSFYTVLSNMLATGISAVWAGFALYNMGKGNYSVPAVVQKLRFVSTSCLCLTFVVVLIVLLPADFAENGSIAIYRKLFSPVNFWHHTAIPVASILSFILLEKKPVLNFKVTLAAIFPTIMYAVVVIFLNILKVLDGPYFFVRVYNQPWFMSVIWTIVVLGLNYGLACGLLALNKIKNK